MTFEEFWEHQDPCPNSFLFCKDDFEEAARMAWNAALNEASEIAKRYEPPDKTAYVTYASQDIRKLRA